MPNASDAAAEVVVPGYEILYELGHGGMGVVYRARQKNLDRPVALKMLRRVGHPTAEERTRFRTEAEATARLQHANIVRIYEVGEVRGQPYLSLEYIGGGTLSERLRGKAMSARDAARLVETLARAVHYAHQHGVVHRDLKPANVLIRDDVERPDQPDSRAVLPAKFTPKISDFGLAKRLDQSDGPTSTGLILGTPSYMAPEQAGGLNRTVGAPADIYALGAILYELLTGRPPFIGPTPLDTVQQVLADDPLPPRQLQPRLPRDLETICLLCLRKDPARRFSSAEALAEDLRRFLSDEPIWARRLGSGERLVKWARRRPATAVAFAAGAVILGGLIAFVAGLLREREHSRIQEQQARDTVARYFTQVSENRLLQEPGMEGLRRQLLSEARDFYEDFVRHQRDAPAAQAEWARSAARLAELTGELGEADNALALARQAEEVIVQLCRQHPADQTYRHDHAAVLARLGMLSEAVGRSVEAEAAYRRAGDLWEKLAAEGSDDPAWCEWQARAAEMHQRLAGLRRTSDQLDDAADELQTARVVLETLTAREPSNLRYRSRLAELHVLVGKIQRARGQDRTAEKDFQEAERRWDTLVGLQPRDQFFNDGLAEALLELGRLYTDLRQPRRSGPAFDRALKLRRQLVRDHGALPGFRHRLVRACLDSARRYLVEEQGYLAEPLLHEANQLGNELVRDFPDCADYRADYGRTQDLLARWYGATGRLRGSEFTAEPASEKGRLAWEKLLRQQPDRNLWRAELAENAHALATAYYQSREDKAAETAFRKAQEIRAALTNEAPQVVRYQFDRAWGEADFGKMLMARQRLDKAGQQLHASRARFNTLVADHPDNARYRHDLADVLETLAHWHTHREQPASAEAMYDEALKLREQLARTYPEVVAYRNAVALTHSARGELFLVQGARDRCLAEFQTAARLQTALLKEQEDYEVRRQLTRHWVHLSEIHLKDGRIPEARDTADRALNNQQALVEAYPRVPINREELAACHDAQAAAWLRSGRPDQAEKCAFQALALREPLVGAYPQNQLFTLRLAATYLKLGRLASRRNEPNAFDWYRRAESLLVPLAPTGAPNQVEAQALLRSAWRSRAIAALRQNRLKVALADWKSLAESTNETESWLASGQIMLLTHGQFRAALLLAELSELVR